MRILVGTMEICRHIHDLGDAFRTLGHEVDTVVIGKSPFYMDLPYDYLINQEKLFQHLAQLVQNPLSTFLQLPDELTRLRHFLTDYDVYVFQFAQSLLPGNRDYPILKQQGKKIISIFNGSDIRHWSAAEPVAAAYNYQIPEMCREEPFCHLPARLLNIRMAERYADAIFSLPFQSELAVRPYWHFFLPFNLDLYGHRIPERDVPVLVHAPSRRKFKGTDRFLAVLDRLRSEGVPFELKLLEGVPNQEVIRTLIEADVVLDELHAPHYAMLALEGMATGCAVVAGCQRDYVPLQGDSPVFNVHAETLYDRLKLLLTDKAVRLDHARRGRPFVEQGHRHTGVAAGLLAKLKRPDEPYEYYPSFFARAYQYPDGETVPEGLKRMTAEIIQRHGLPDGMEPDALVERRLIAPEGLSPDKPVLHWRPAASYGVKEQIWGWSPRADKVIAEASQNDADDKVYAVIHLVEQALDALDEADAEAAGAMLQQCIEQYQADPETFGHADVLTALGRLAVELDHQEAALALLTQAYKADPTRSSLQQTLQTLVAKVAA